MSDYKLDGLGNMTKAFDVVIKEFPYESEKKLQSVGNKFRRAVREKTPDSSITHKRKLKKSYKLSKPIGYGQDIRIEFWSNAPHFHLIERGHKKVTKSGRQTGFVPGTHMVERTCQEFENELPNEVEKFLNKMIRKM